MHKVIRDILNPMQFLKKIRSALYRKYHRWQERQWARQDSSTIRHFENVLFVDLGANIGQGYAWFKRYFNLSNVVFELFEPNPFCANVLQSLPDVKSGITTLHRCGVGVIDGTFDFFGLNDDEGGKYSEGGSIVKAHNSAWYEASDAKSIKVKIINFSKYLENKKLNFDKIIVKMDIEGAEIELLEHLISTGSIALINILYIEFHSEYQSPDASRITKQREDIILEALSGISTLKVRIWH